MGRFFYESHIHAIQGLKTAAGAAAFVVQQSDPDWAQAINYVIAPTTMIKGGTGLRPGQFVFDSPMGLRCSRST